MLRLTGHDKEYDWGSTSAIQHFLGRPADGHPLAEVWFGAHPSGPTGTDAAEPETSLASVISADPMTALGTRIVERFGTDLPFLAKLLAPGRAVSLQVHPSRAAAQAGYRRELHDGLAIAKRSFSDANHKPEMIFALTTFDGLVGFNTASQAAAVTDRFAHPAMAAVHRRLDQDGPDALASAFAALAALDTRTATEILAEARRLSESIDEAPDSIAGTAIDTVASLSRIYPDDAGAVASLLLRRIRLEPGEAVFVPSGTPHSYLSGLAVEVMANSDNVFRAGMTTKRVDLEAVLDNLLTAEPTIFRTDAEGIDSASSVRFITPEVEEFALAVFDVSTGSSVTDEADGPRLVIVTDGVVRMTSRRGDQAAHGLDLHRGQAAFVADGVRSVTFSGDGRAVMVLVPV